MKLLHHLTVLAALSLSLAQLYRLWAQPEHYLLIGGLLLLPVLTTFPGLLISKLYTVRWSGFIALYYFTWSLSELFASPDWRSYAVWSSLSSVIWFLSLIYLARALKLSRSVSN